MSQDNDGAAERRDRLSRLHEAVRANQTANDVWDDCVTRFLGINRTDGRCLDIIERHGRITAGALASEAGLSTGTVTILVDRLEAAGYAARERDPADRRKVWIVPTAYACDVSRRLFGHFDHLGPAIRARFTPEEQAAIIEFLEMGTRISVAQASRLETYVERKAATPEARLVTARLFERDAADAMDALTADRTGTID